MVSKKFNYKHFMNSDSLNYNSQQEILLVFVILFNLFINLNKNKEKIKENLTRLKDFELSYKNTLSERRKDSHQLSWL